MELVEGRLPHDKACSCGALIAFARTARGASMPMNLEPDPEGNVRLKKDLDGSLTATVLGDASGQSMLPMKVASVRYRAHFDTCPDADRYRYAD